MAAEDLFVSPARSIKNSVTIKIVVIGVLILVLLIPASMIKSIISEREGRKNTVIEEISDKWGHSQMIIGPIVSIPYKTYHMEDAKEVYAGIEYAHFLPEELSFNGVINPEIRYRGIFEAILYNTEVNIHSTFNAPDFSEWGIADEDILYNDACITLGLSDLRGIKEDIVIRFDDKEIIPEPGVLTSPLLSNVHSGVTAKIALTADGDKKETFTLNTNLNVNGSGRLSFVPLGKKTTTRLQSKWSNPSFEGAFLPGKREITPDGFSASWKIFNFNRNFPQKWRSGDYSLGSAAFGVRFISPVDEYLQISRSTKYSILFITLTFLAFFIIEVLNKRRVHPIQYLLIGFALCLFFTLLLSLTEHTSFAIAYITASASTVLLIAFYTRSVLKSTPFSLGIGILISILYAFLYIILQLQDYSLLVGSSGLFIILALVMFVTRKVDWYNIGLNQKEIPA